jgi:hypothetical protein
VAKFSKSFRSPNSPPPLLGVTRFLQFIKGRGWPLHRVFLPRLTLEHLHIDTTPGHFSSDIIILAQHLVALATQAIKNNP